jgi:uracil-DNA glycosylase family 4
MDPDSGSEDLRPRTAMVDNCRPFLDREIVLVNPQVIVTLGAFPLEALLRMMNAHTKVRLEDFIGKSRLWNSRLVVFFPHTSGGSRWLNDRKNQVLFAKAKRVLRSELIARNII